jgi:cytochrome c oxidase subunit 2
MSWILPPAASTFADDIDGLYYLILWVTGIAFVLVQATLVWFLFRYRARPGRRARHYHGSWRAEVVWTAVPAIGVLMLGIASARVWAQIKGREAAPAGSYPVAVHASQFEWHVTYPGRDGLLGTPDDFRRRNQLHVPVDRPVLVKLTAEDVIHSFFVPAFRLKQDAVPGMEIPVWFRATVPGEYELGCAELCGLGHYRMRAAVTVHPAADFERWATEEARRGDDN